jgi:DNA polymerase
LSKDKVAQALGQDGLIWAGPTTRRVLEIRQEVAKSSTKKLDAMLRCAGPDGRVRGQLAYYGAFRTGRFAGRLIQPQNFPRPSIKLIAHAVQNVLDGVDPDFLRLVYGAPLDVAASLLRSCLIPGPGRRFIIYDLAQIEARVVAWLASQTDILQVFERGEDVYAYTASKLGSANRQFGKVLVLACGFGMGATRFQETAKTYGLDLTLAQCDEAVQGWRQANPKIVDLWQSVDRAVRTALKEFAWRGSKPQVDEPINDKLSVSVSLSRTGTPLMTLRLPSGRRLYYRNARIQPSACDSGRWLRGEIAYDGVDQHTKQWTTLRTYGGKLVENITQAAARDVIVEAALRVDARGLGDLVLSVHDELVFEADSESSQKLSHEIRQEIDRRPTWALDLPVASEGGIKARYGK